MLEVLALVGTLDYRATEFDGERRRRMTASPSVSPDSFARPRHAVYRAGLDLVSCWLTRCDRQS